MLELDAMPELALELELDAMPELELELDDPPELELPPVPPVPEVGAPPVAAAPPPPPCVEGVHPAAAPKSTRRSLARRRMVHLSA